MTHRRPGPDGEADPYNSSQETRELQAIAEFWLHGHRSDAATLARIEAAFADITDGFVDCTNCWREE